VLEAEIAEDWPHIDLKNRLLSNIFDFWLGVEPQ
jgi:hypothetical protein